LKHIEVIFSSTKAARGKFEITCVAKLAFEAVLKKRELEKCE
jgi:hypothetical protein